MPIDDIETKGELQRFVERLIFDHQRPVRARDLILFVQGYASGETFLPNSGFYARMKADASTDATLTLTPGTWLVEATLMTRSDTTQDFSGRLRIVDVTDSAESGPGEFAVGFTQRNYWGVANLLGYSSTTIRGIAVITSGTKTIAAEAKSNGTIGGYAFTGTPSHNILTATKVKI